MLIKSVYIYEIVFHINLWLKTHYRCRKKLTVKKLNVNRHFFKDVLCLTLLQEGVGQYQFLAKIATYFPNFHEVTPSLKWIFLYIPPTPFGCNPRPCLPTVLIIHNIYSWKIMLKHTGVDIKCFFVNKNFFNKT